MVRFKAINTLCEHEFEKIGVSIYLPTADEKNQWQERCGYARSEWGSYKKSILGDSKIFEELIEASRTQHSIVL